MLEHMPRSYREKTAFMPAKLKVFAMASCHRVAYTVASETQARGPRPAYGIAPTLPAATDGLPNQKLMSRDGGRYWLVIKSLSNTPKAFTN
jgi:hypothetical protein